jgi:hypothetical protein
MDGMSIEAFPAFARQHWERIRSALEAGTYRPAAVLRAMIPKDTGGERPLGMSMCHAYCISLAKVLGIAVALPTSLNRLYRLTQYSEPGVADQVSSCKNRP